MSYRFFAALVVIIVAPIAEAQDYPNRPVRVLVPQPAGSTPDMVTRLVTPGLSSLLGQQFVVDNRGGAGGMIGTDIGAKATQGAESAETTPRQFEALLQKETESYARAVKASGMKID